MRISKAAPVLAVLLAAPLPGQFGGGNDLSFRPRFESTNDSSSGRCRLRIRVDDEAEVMMQGDTVRVRVIRGGPARDDGSECTAPLPRTVREFDFEKTDGRGRAELISRPDRGNRLLVRVRDSGGGDDKYTLDFRWSGGSGGWNSGGDDSWRYRDRNRDPFSTGGRDRDRDRDRDRVGQAARLCEDAVRGRLATDHGVSSADLRLTDVDENRRGNRDVIEGEARVRGSRDRYAFRCRVNLDSGRLRDVDVRRR
ncbi:MAG: hypothetical protein SFV54_05720 [Bryobacteraceae bacterium]|nr:hypothetical protein [Bryobacteraceae bacterium]